MSKKITYLLLFTILTYSAVLGQNRIYGAKAGLNLSRIINQENKFQSDSLITGLKIGVYSKFILNHRFNLIADLCYSQVGGQSFFTNAPLRLGRISTSAMAGVVIDTSLAIQLGPELSLLTHSNNKEFRNGHDLIDIGICTGLTFWPVSYVGISIRNYLGLKYNETEAFPNTESKGPVKATIYEDTGAYKYNVITIAINYDF